MRKTLKDLFLAMLNATLILVALCLVLGLMLVGRANSLSDRFSENLRTLTPLRDNIEATGAEIAALRSDIASLRDPSIELPPEALARVEDRMAKMEARLDTIQASTKELRDAPKQMLDQAIAQAADETVTAVARLRGCVPTDKAPATDG